MTQYFLRNNVSEHSHYIDYSFLCQEIILSVSRLLFSNFLNMLFMPSISCSKSNSKSLLTIILSSAKDGLSFTSEIIPLGSMFTANKFLCYNYPRKIVNSTLIWYVMSLYI